MPRKSLSISDEILKRLENEITNKILGKINSIVSIKCKEILAQHHQQNNNDELLIRHEINTLKNDWLFLQSEIEQLKEKADYTLGGLSYIANEYDDFLTDIKKLKNQNQSIIEEFSQINQNVEQIHKQQIENEEQLDRLEQYGRRENLELHGIPVKENENTNEIVKEVAKSLDINLEDQVISTSHRLFDHKPRNEREPGQANDKRNQHPPIIVRFSNRDKRNELYSKRWKIKDKLTTKSSCVPPTLAIRENLTERRKYLLNEAMKVKLDLKFRFLSTFQGQIFLRKNEATKAIKILCLNDLARLVGSSKSRVR